MNNWYQKDIKVVENYFDVDSNKGLSLSDVLVRRKKFGSNDDPFLNSCIRSVYKTNVKREGRIDKTSTNNLVLGDIVFLEEGDRVPADIRLSQVKSLKIDQSNLTGEALVSDKNTYAIKHNATIKDQKCMAFTGSFVSSGSGIGVVTALAQKSAQKDIKRNIKTKNTLINHILFRRIKKSGVFIQHPSKIKLLKNIDFILIDMTLSEQEVYEFMTKVQLAKNISCKFIVDSHMLDRLKRDLTGAITYDGKKIANHVPRQFINMVKDAQFITNVATPDIVKLLSGLRSHSLNTLLITDGARPPETVEAAYLSLVVGHHARDDVYNRADMISLKSKIAILDKIL